MHTHDIGRGDPTTSLHRPTLYGQPIYKTVQAVQIQPICIANVDHDYILDEVERRDHIDHERKINNYDK